MGNVHCTTCGAEAHSKCPYCRNIFEDSQRGFGMEARQGTDENGRLNGVDEFQLSCSWKFDADHKATSAELFELTKELHARAVELSADEFAQMFCRHTWEFKPGEKSTISCGH